METRIATRCIHGEGGGKHGGEPVAPAIVRSSTFRLDDQAYAMRREGHGDRARVYTRETNPTLEHVEDRIASLEGADRSLLFASGTAALHAALMALLQAGDNVVAFRQLYGGSTTLFRKLFPKLGVELRQVDVNDLGALRQQLDGNTRLIFCESITNPTTAVSDIPAVAELRNEISDRIQIVVDATAASPIGQRPLELGADVVFHSATKYLGGHSDLMGGVLSATGEVARAIWEWRTAAGGIMDPEAAFLVERGLKTLALRMDAQAEGATLVARFLEDHPKVSAVNYCGLESHPDHERALSLLDCTGGLLSFVVRAGDDAALAVMRRLRVITEAASFGGVESLASRPIDMSHAALSREERESIGVEPGLVRLSVGIEDPLDLIEDLAQALGA